MSLLRLDDVHRHYGAQDVLRGASLQIDPGQKLGLVGRNGGGKTTILRLIAGEEAADRGTVTVARGARLGHVPQLAAFGPGVTTRDHVRGGMAEVLEAAAQLEEIGERMGRVEGGELERLMKEHDRLTARIEGAGGWEIDRRVETVMSGIGLGKELWDREADTLSGGEKSRAALARELVAGHDLLLLDEPTNHLDLAGIEWIEAWIREIPGAVLIVSHDRRLLSSAVDAIVELEGGRLRRYPGNYGRYLELREERHKTETRAFELQQDVIRREEALIRKHMGSQRTTEAKGRQKRLDHIVRLERPVNDIRRPRIKPPKAARGGELVLEAAGLAAGYDSNELFRGVGLRIGRGDRVGIVGRNGAGKTTLLKILAGRGAPSAGEVTYGHKAVCALYDQDTSRLHEDGTPYTEIRRERPAWTDLEVRNHLARFLFRGAEVDKPIPALSGGERARLCLSLLVLSEPSWMALDEPTNHLDLAGRTALEEMLSEFGGALVCISHDREFLDGLCTRIVEVLPGSVRSFPGNYSAWRRAREQEEAALLEARRRKAPPRKSAGKPRSESSAPARAGKIRNPWRFKRLEERIIRLEEKLEKRQAELTKEEVYRDANRVREVQVRIAEIERELQEANAEWESWA